MANPTDLISFIGVVKWLNTNTNGIFAYLLPLAVLGVLFMAMKNYDTKKAFLASFFLTSIFCLYWGSIGLVSSWFVAFFIAGTMGSALWVLLGGD